MTDDEIKKVVCEVYEAEKAARGSWLDGFAAIYRAGLAAGRAEAAAKPKRRKDAVSQTRPHTDVTA